MPKKTTTRHTEKNNNSSPGTGRKFMNIDHPKIQSAAANGKILLNFTGLEAMATAIERLRNLYSSTPIRWVDGKFAVPAGFTMADDLAEKLTSVEQKIRWCQTFTPFQLAEDSKTGPIFTAPGTLVLADGYVIPVPHRYAYCNAADGGVVTLGPPEFGAAGCCRLTSTLAIKCRGKGKPVWFPPVRPVVLRNSVIRNGRTRLAWLIRAQTVGWSPSLGFTNSASTRKITRNTGT